MRESNFAFPAQNRACVCISSQLYDRRALDTTSPLPLFNSLTHLTYLTSTSPRIREILTMDGGLERLVRLLRDFCAHPPPPESPAQFYGLLPPTHTKTHAPMHAPYDPKKPFDRAAAYRFSLAFQCVVNIGVRGSEPIRARVVQAGTLDVVGCVLEAWLASKGFAVGPSASASGMPRESREQRQARRLAVAEMRQREVQAMQAQELARELQRHVGSRIDEDEEMLDVSAERIPSDGPTFISARNVDVSPFISSHTPTDDLSSSAAQAASTSDTSNDTSPTSTPRGGGTPTGTVGIPARDRSGTVIARPATWDTITPTETTHSRRRSTLRATPSTSTAAAAAARTDTEPESDADAEMDDAAAPGPPSGSEPPAAPLQQGRRAVGIVGDDDTAALEVDMGLDMLLAGAGADGFVALDPAGVHPHAAPRDPEDRTPRAAFARLPDTQPPPQPTPAPAPVPAHAHVHAHVPPPHETGPYREEDVLLSLQLLAYLSKYPHVRQAFYKPRAVFTPAAAAGAAGTPAAAALVPPVVAPKEASGGFFKALAGATVGRGKDKDKHRASTAQAAATATEQSTACPPRARALTQSTNVFSLVERFTFRPSPTETALPAPPPLLPPEIQYWAGVIMRNACRKDESRGGIRQCANMLCGRWESFPREFAKCRRCRKAKYCGKECQSRAWAEGHRFWCSAREEEGAGAGAGGEAAAGGVGGEGEEGAVGVVRPRGERERVRGGGHAHAHGHAGPSRAVAAGVPPTVHPSRIPARVATAAVAPPLHRSGLEPAGRGPPPGHASYTRPRVNAMPAPYVPPRRRNTTGDGEAEGGGGARDDDMVLG